jgi:hypothetical protein
MTFTIAQSTPGRTPTIRLIGRIQAEHLEKFKAQMRCNGPRIVLDIEEVMLVDAEVVRYLCPGENNGTKLVDCPLYIRELIRLEYSYRP